MLKQEGYHVIAAESVETAEQRLSDCEADVALLDVRLPGRTGDEFGADLKRRCGEQTKIVFLTAEADTARLREYVPDAIVLPKAEAFRVLDILRSIEGRPVRAPPESRRND
jgi:CheY-like chemotaxis protein